MASCTLFHLGEGEAQEQERVDMHRVELHGPPVGGGYSTRKANGKAKANYIRLWVGGMDS